MRRWSVVSGLLELNGCLLLVANRRRNGSIDWSPPGGVVDDGEGAVAALDREVIEETGLTVAGWHGPAYEVFVDFADAAMDLRVAVYCATSWSGSLTCDDPDGIVHEAGFFAVADCRHRLAASPAWVADPLVDWLTAPWVGSRGYEYSVSGRLGDAMTVNRRP